MDEQSDRDVELDLSMDQSTNDSVVMTEIMLSNALDVPSKIAGRSVFEDHPDNENDEVSITKQEPHRTSIAVLVSINIVAWVAQGMRAD